MKFVPESMMPREPKVVLESDNNYVRTRIEYPMPDPRDYNEEYYYSEDPNDYRDSE